MQLNQAQSYELVCLAGDGGQAQVYLARKQQQNFILKIYFPHPSVLTYFSREVDILSRLHSPHIVRLIEHFPQGKITIGADTHIKPIAVLQLAQHGDLFKLVNTGRFSEDASRTLFKQLIQALRVMKQAEVAHLDIKLENILLDQEYNLKLTDFGYARNLMQQPDPFTSWQGTQGYMAPEIHDRFYRGYDVDIFAAGVVLFLMIFRTPPFENTIHSNPDYNLIRKGKFQEFWRRFEKICAVTMPLKRLLTRVFSVDPKSRPSLSELQNEEWLSGPTLNKQELKKYMDSRYRRLEKIDEETINIRKALKLKLESMLNQQKEIQKRSRSREKHSKRSNEEINVQQNMTAFVTQIEELQYSCNYVQMNPKAIIPWLFQLMALAKSNATPLIEATDEVELLSYDIEPKKKGKIQLVIEYCLTINNDSWTIDLKLEGKVVTWQQKVGLIWSKKEGSDFWASQIKANLEQQFYITFG